MQGEKKKEKKKEGGRGIPKLLLNKGVEQKAKGQRQMEMIT